MINLYKFQKDILEETKTQNKVAYYLDMGLGKTYVGSEKAISLGDDILLICQKSKINDWIEHFFNNYNNINTCNLTEKDFYKNGGFENAERLKKEGCWKRSVFIINYELAFRRPQLLQLNNFTLMLDESSMIQNEKAKRSKFIKKLKFKNLILLSGTPCSGKYDKLLSQINLLGWNISEDLFYKQYVEFHYNLDNGFPLRIIDGYKNVDRLKLKLREHGCRFLKTNEVFDLPKQVFNKIKINVTPEYTKFKKDRIITIDNNELVGDTTLTKMLYERQLCGQYNKNKLEALIDILNSTEDRIIIFYNFNEELKEIKDICVKLEKSISIINGKDKDLTNYEECENSVTLIQYQAGSMGLNLQKANKMVYFTPPLSSELFEQSKKRIHRIGQNNSCFYYQLICRNSIEEKIYKLLNIRKDYTNKLFEEDEVD